TDGKLRKLDPATGEPGNHFNLLSKMTKITTKDTTRHWGRQTQKAQRAPVGIGLRTPVLDHVATEAGYMGFIRLFDLYTLVLNEHVYGLLETETKLYKLPVPIDTKAEARTHVFVSVDIFSNTDKLLILVHGSGVVRAGQWARR
ncbi:unnamed protein product, partial [Timema podura]|nr:unnamed protein product [Timema podura]